MNREQLIEKGKEIEQLSDFSAVSEQYEKWKTDVLRYAKKDTLIQEQCRVLLHVVDTPYESVEEKKKKYSSCIKKTINFLRENAEGKQQEAEALENIIHNFGLYLQNMFGVVPENKATLQKEILEQIAINNEYDLQHMMYAVIKALYPSARREVNQDTGYGTVRFDIIIKEIDTVIEIKCTRKDHSDKKLCRELGEDGYFYTCSNLIIYVYDKYHVIRDADNFIKALERNKETAGKEVKVYVEQAKELI